MWELVWERVWEFCGSACVCKSACGSSTAQESATIVQFLTCAVHAILLSLNKIAVAMLFVARNVCMVIKVCMYACVCGACVVCEEGVVCLCGAGSVRCEMSGAVRVMCVCLCDGCGVVSVWCV